MPYQTSITQRPDAPVLLATVGAETGLSEDAAHEFARGVRGNDPDRTVLVTDRDFRLRRENDLAILPLEADLLRFVPPPNWFPSSRAESARRRHRSGAGVSLAHRTGANAYCGQRLVCLGNRPPQATGRDGPIGARTFPRAGTLDGSDKGPRPIGLRHKRGQEYGIPAGPHRRSGPPGRRGVQPMALRPDRTRRARTGRRAARRRHPAARFSLAGPDPPPPDGTTALRTDRGAINTIRAEHPPGQRCRCAAAPAHLLASQV